MTKNTNTLKCLNSSINHLPTLQHNMPRSPISTTNQTKQILPTQYAQARSLPSCLLNRRICQHSMPRRLLTTSCLVNKTCPARKHRKQDIVPHRAKQQQTKMRRASEHVRPSRSDPPGKSAKATNTSRSIQPIPTICPPHTVSQSRPSPQQTDQTNSANTICPGTSPEGDYLPRRI